MLRKKVKQTELKVYNLKFSKSSQSISFENIIDFDAVVFNLKCLTPFSRHNHTRTYTKQQSNN